MIQELEAAVKRGVKVQILANGWDAFFAHGDKVTRTAYEILLKQIAATGAEIREFQGPGKIHSKQVAIDGKKCNVWSYNIDSRSKHINLEAGVQITAAHFCEKMTARIQARHHMGNLAARDGVKVRPSKCSTLFDRVLTKALWNNL